MITKSENTDRRRVLKYLGMTLLGLTSLPLISKAPKNAEAGVFASLFLQDPPRVQIPPGYYDPEAQLYFNAQTNKPMFVAEAKEEAKPLSEKELADFLKDGFISLKEHQKDQEELIKVRGKATRSTYTTLKTTYCCPIITDRESDTIPDD